MTAEMVQDFTVGAILVDLPGEEMVEAVAELCWCRLANRRGKHAWFGEDFGAVF